MEHGQGLASPRIEQVTPEQYNRVKQIYFAAQELDADKRAGYLAEQCSGDAEMEKAVAELLASSGKAEDFMEQPAYEVLSETLAPEIPATSVTGKQIGPYRITREIDHGGMGTVYLAERDDDVYQKQVAIKIVRAGFDTDELRRRFYDERKILARLDHPYIAKLLDGGTTEEGLPYYVMDYVEGVSLIEYCGQNELATNERLQIFRKVCEAVQYAHQNLVVHRDLKPSNILVTREGKPQLLDFGIAKVFQDEEAAEATRTQLRVMTPEYASPEQLSGKIVTTASDVYSLGIILYELLTGQRPFEFKHGSLEEIILAVCQTEPSAPSVAITRRAKDQTPPATIVDPQIARRLKGDLDNIVLKALKKEPARRYASAEQLGADIRRHLEGLPVMARPDTVWYRSSKFVTRHKFGVAAATAVFLLLLAGAVAIVRQTRIAQREALVAAQQRDRAQREQVRATRISKFFQDMLGYANPSWYAPGNDHPPDLTVVAALDEAARRIEGDLNEEPEVKVEILLTIGDTYAAIGKYEPSERVLELAVKLSREVHGEDSIKFADALYFLANTKRALRKRQEMEALYQQAHSVYNRHSDRGKQYPYFLLDYAGLFSVKGDHAGNIRVTGEAVEMLRRLNGDGHPSVAMALMNLAAAYMGWGDPDNALAHAQAAHRIQPDNPQIILRLGQAYVQKGELGKAEPLLLDVVARYEREKNLAMQVGPLVWLANLYQDQGDHGKAEAFIARAVANERQSYAPDNPALLGHLVAQGLIQTRAGKRDRCELAIRQATARMSAEQRQEVEPNRGECLFAQGRYAEAAPLLLNYYRGLKVSQHPASPSLKRVRDHLLVVCADLKKTGPPALQTEVCEL